VSTSHSVAGSRVTTLDKSMFFPKMGQKSVRKDPLAPPLPGAHSAPIYPAIFDFSNQSKTFFVVFFSVFICLVEQSGQLLLHSIFVLPHHSGASGRPRFGVSEMG
jgi:hypothetical protein